MRHFWISISSDAQGWSKEFRIDGTSFPVALAKAGRLYRKELRGKKIKEVSLKLKEMSLDPQLS